MLFPILHGLLLKSTTCLNLPCHSAEISIVHDGAFWKNGTYPFALTYLNGSYTPLVKHIEMWSNVQGTRIYATSSNLNVQILVLQTEQTDGAELIVIMNNLRDSVSQADIAFDTVSKIAVFEGSRRRLYFSNSQNEIILERDQPFLQNGSSTIFLKPNELTIVRIPFKGPTASSSGTGGSCSRY